MSVVVPVYNCRRYLAEAVASALQQRGSDLELEVVIVDDSSTDGSYELAKCIAAENPDRVRVYRQRRRGPAAARNHGARKAQGEWLAFLDGDDVWLPNKLERQLLCARPNVGMIYTDRSTFGRGLPDRRLSEDVRLQRGDVFDALIHNNFITASSVLLRRDAFEALGGFCEFIYGAEDWDLWLRYAHDHPVELVVEPLTRYRRHPAGVSSDTCALFLAQCKVLGRALATPRGRSVDRAALRSSLVGGTPTEPRARDYIGRMFARCGQSTYTYLTQSLRHLTSGHAPAPKTRIAYGGVVSDLPQPDMAREVPIELRQQRVTRVP